jgi:hypothetical protein
MRVHGIEPVVELNGIDWVVPRVLGLDSVSCLAVQPWKCKKKGTNQRKNLFVCIREVYRASPASLVSQCEYASVPSHVCSSICMGLGVLNINMYAFITTETAALFSGCDAYRVRFSYSVFPHFMRNAVFVGFDIFTEVIMENFLVVKPCSSVEIHPPSGLKSKRNK